MCYQQLPIAFFFTTKYTGTNIITRYKGACSEKTIDTTRVVKIDSFRLRKMAKLYTHSLEHENLRNSYVNDAKIL